MLRAGYDVKYFGDKGFGSKVVYMQIREPGIEAHEVSESGVANAAPLDPRFKRGPVG